MSDRDERDQEIVAWLVKKAWELDRVPNSRRESAPDAVRRLAGKLDHGAVRESSRHYMIQSVWALKSQVPDGSEHFRSGWDVALDAVLDLLGDNHG